MSLDIVIKKLLPVIMHLTKILNVWSHQCKHLFFIYYVSGNSRTVKKKSDSLQASVGKNIK